MKGTTLYRPTFRFIALLRNQIPIRRPAALPAANTTSPKVARSIFEAARAIAYTAKRSERLQLGSFFPTVKVASIREEQEAGLAKDCTEDMGG